MEAMLILDKWWWLILPGLILGLYAQVKLTSAYGRFSRVETSSGLSGAEAARAILDSAGLQGLPVHEIPGHLTDHYDPLKRALFLSSENYHGRTIAAVGVAAHESGHALQHKAAYAPLKARMVLVPITQFASNAAMWITFLGWFMGLAKIASIAVIVFAIIALFQTVTLPVEFDASRRAKRQLLQLGLVDVQEQSGVSKVLNAAALTYVAAMVASILTLLHFILIARGDNRN
jgi:Zn-dependent membrane protease YugP